MRLLIGIISYLPDEESFRKVRVAKLNKLINTCNYLFSLPIYIVTQNYKEKEIEFFSKCPNVLLSDNYDRLGILQARRTLREFFINSPYTNLIMLDDDCEVIASYDSAKRYLKQIQDNKDCFIEFNDSLLKLFCISKDIFKEVDYEDVSPENEEGFEDRVFVEKLRKLFKDKRRVFDKTDISEVSNSSNDRYSTWSENKDMKKMLLKTEDKINNISC